MPIYEFHCEACDATFDTMTSMNARDQKVSCPKCNSKKTARKLSVVSVSAGAASETSGSGHTHSGMCGCGKRAGSCGMN